MMSDELHPEIVIGDLGGDHIVIGVQDRLLELLAR
jgi:hypothetical protein